MRKFILFFLSALFTVNLYSQDTQAQSKEKNYFVGAMYRPNLNQDLIDGFVVHYSALRFGMKFPKYNPLYLGTEFQRTDHSNNLSKICVNSFGLLARYTLRESKGFRPFLELQPLISFTKYTCKTSSCDDNGNNTGTNFSWYAAPGFSFNIYRRIVTLDVMLKVSTDKFFLRKHVQGDYRLNVWF